MARRADSDNHLHGGAAVFNFNGPFPMIGSERCLARSEHSVPSML